MFDVLVSKYIDGILSPEEDRELRAILSDNPLAKEQFNLAVSLHIAMSDTEEDDSQLDNIILQTETQLFEKLGVDAPKRVAIHSYSSSVENSAGVSLENKPIERRKRIFTAPRLSVTVMLFLLFVNVVSDSIFTVGSNSKTNTLSANNNALQNNGIASLGSQDIHETISLVNSVETNINEVNSVISETESNNIIVSSFASKAEESEANDHPYKSAPSDTLHFLPFSTAISDINNPLFSSRSISYANLPSNSVKTQISDLGKETVTATKVDISVVNGMPSGLVATKNTDIPTTPVVFDGLVAENSSQEGEGKLHIGSFLNNGFVYAGNNKATASSFSQSIGYGVTSATKIGLEMGRVGYSFTQPSLNTMSQNPVGINGRNTVAANYSKNSTSIMGKEDNNGNDDINNLNSSATSSSSNQDVALVWGGAFVEQMVVNTSDFDINVRGGIGVAGDGAVLFARTYAEYKLSSFMSVTFGGEGKNFTIRNASRSEKPLSSNYMIGLVYGLQIKF